MINYLANAEANLAGYQENLALYSAAISPPRKTSPVLWLAIAGALVAALLIANS